MTGSVSRTRLTVQGWVNLLLVVMALLVCGGGVVGGLVLGRSSEVTDALTDRLLPATVSAYQLQAALVNQETGVRGYALTGNSDFLQPYQDGLQVQQQAADRIRSLIADRPELVADLDALDSTAQIWRTGFAAPVLALPPSTTGRAAPPEFYDRSRESFDQIRGLFDQQNRDLAAAVSDAQSELDRMRLVRNLTFTAVGVGLLIAAAAVAVLIRLAVTAPLTELAASARLVAQGHLDRRIDVARGPADIRSLAADVEAMRRRIVTELAAVRRRQAELEEQTAQLDAQAVDLRRSNADLEQFAYVASHDLQEPLRKVASFCQLLERRYDDVLDDRGRQYIDFAVDGARRMQALINDLLAFSRVGRSGDEFERIPLGDTLDTALANVAALVEDSGAVVERPEVLPQVDCDPGLLIMLWQNLIGNAVKFTPPGDRPEILVTATRDGGDLWRICVQDNGIGVPAEFAEKIFVIFQRLHPREAYTGTGIGLALCKKIVEYHGGSIWLDTSYDDGARFCFTLPALPEPDRTAEPDRTPEPEADPTGGPH